MFNKHRQRSETYYHHQIDSFILSKTQAELVCIAME